MEDAPASRRLLACLHCTLFVALNRLAQSRGSRRLRRCLAVRRRSRALRRIQLHGQLAVGGGEGGVLLAHSGALLDAAPQIVVAGLRCRCQLPFLLPHQLFCDCQRLRVGHMKDFEKLATVMPCPGSAQASCRDDSRCSADVVCTSLAWTGMLQLEPKPSCWLNSVVAPSQVREDPCLLGLSQCCILRSGPSSCARLCGCASIAELRICRAQVRGFRAPLLQLCHARS